MDRYEFMSEQEVFVGGTVGLSCDGAKAWIFNLIRLKSQHPIGWVDINIWNHILRCNIEGFALSNLTEAQIREVFNINATSECIARHIWLYAAGRSDLLHAQESDRREQFAKENPIRILNPAEWEAVSHIADNIAGNFQSDSVLSHNSDMNFGVPMDGIPMSLNPDNGNMGYSMFSMFDGMPGEYTNTAGNSMSHILSDTDRRNLGGVSNAFMAPSIATAGKQTYQPPMDYTSNSHSMNFAAFNNMPINPPIPPSTVQQFLPHRGFAVGNEYNPTPPGSDSSMNWLLEPTHYHEIMNGVNLDQDTPPDLPNIDNFDPEINALVNPNQEAPNPLPNMNRQEPDIEELENFDSLMNDDFDAAMSNELQPRTNSNAELNHNEPAMNENDVQNFDYMEYLNLPVDME